MSNSKQNRINKLRKLQNNKCCYCTREMEKDLFQHYKLKAELTEKQFQRVYKKWQNNPLRPTIEHLTPTINGGSNTEGNILISCHFCNTQKGRMSHEDYSKLVYDIHTVTLFIMSRNIKKKAKNAKQRIFYRTAEARKRLDEMINIE